MLDRARSWVPALGRELRYLSAAPRASVRAMHADLKVEQIVTGNLKELNGKYKLRVAAVTYDLGGFIGNHHHAGPGLRCVTAGTLTYVQEGETSYGSVRAPSWKNK